MDSNGIIFDIKIGSTKEVLKSLRDVKRYIEGLSDTIDSIDKSLPELVGSTDKTAMKRVASDVNKLMRDMKKVSDQFTSFDSASNVAVRDVLYSVKRTGNALGRLSSQIVDAMGDPSVIEELIPLQRDITKEVLSQRDAQENLNKRTKEGNSLLKDQEKLRNRSKRAEPKPESLRRTPASFGGASRGFGTTAIGLGRGRGGFGGGDRIGDVADSASQSLKEIFMKMKIDVGILGAQTNVYGEVVEGYAMTVGKASELIRKSAESIAAIPQRARDVQASIKGMSNTLSGWSKTIGELNKYVQSAGKGSGFLSKALGTASKGIGMAAKGLSFMSKAAGPASAAIEAVSIGFEISDAIMGKSSEQIQANIKAIEAEMRARERANQVIRRGSARSIQEEIDEIELQIQAQRDYTMELARNAAQLTSGFDQLRTIVGTVFGDKTVYGAAGDRMKEARIEMRALERQLAYFRDETVRANTAVQIYRTKIKDQAEDIARDLESSDKELLDARRQIIVKQNELVLDLEKAQKEFDLEAASAKRDREKEDIEALREHLNELGKMEKDYNKKLVDMRDEHLKSLLDLEKEYIRDLAEEMKSYRKALEEEDKEYQKSFSKQILAYQEESVKAQEDYNKRLSEIQERFNKDKIKREKNLASELFQAEMDNDALQYFMLKRNAEEAEKEAEEQHAEELANEKERFDEERAEKEKAHKEELEKIREEHKEKIAQMKIEHIEKISLRKTQFEEEMAQQKAKHEEAIRQAKVEYDLERGQAVESFRKKKEEIEVQRKMEDEANLKKLAAERAALEKSFQLELEYFKNREEALMSFMSEGRKLVETKKIIEDIFRYGTGTVSESQGSQIISALSREMDRIRANARNDGDRGLSEQESAQYYAMNRLIKSFEQAIGAGAGGKVDIRAILDDTALAQMGGNIYNAVMDSVSESLNEKLIQLQKDMSIDLQFDKELEREAARAAQAIKDAGGQLYGDIVSRHQDMLNEMQIQETEAGLQRQAEIAEQISLQNEILASKGKESLSELEETATKLGDKIIENFETTVQNEIEAQRARIEANEKWLQNREENESQFEQDIITATNQANENILAEEKAFKEALAAEARAQNLMLAEEQENSNRTRIDKEAEFANKREALVDEHNSRELTREEEKFIAAEELAKAHFEMEMERKQQQFERETELMTAFIKEFENIFSKTTNELFRGIQRSANSGTNSVIQSYANMTKAIVNTAANGLATLLNYIEQASKNSSSGNRIGNTGNSKIQGLAAAKGALIDKPTLLIAGEGQQPELVIPFDESKGIPDDAMRSFASALSAQSIFPREQAVNSIGGSNDGVLLGVLSALKSMKGSMELRIDRIDIGSNITREEVRSQLRNLQTTIIEVLQEKINA